MSTTHSLKIPATSRTSSFSSSQTIIEPEQQQQLQRQLQRSSSARSTSHHHHHHHQEPPTHDEQHDPDDSGDEDHERRLRLIEVHRTRTRLLEEQHDHQPPLAVVCPSDESPPTAVLINEHLHQHSKEPLVENNSIPLDILLSPINAKKSFHFPHLLTIAELITHLLNHWPPDWCQAGFTIPHHVNQFRMVYMGRFLDEQETLSSLGKMRPLIIHLVIKPDAGSPEDEEGDEDRAGPCGCWGMLRARVSRRAGPEGASDGGGSACLIS